VALKHDTLIDADEGIATGLVVFFHGLEEEGVAGAVVEFVEGGDGRFGVGDELGENGDEITVGGELAELRERWKTGHGIRKKEVGLRK